MNETIVTRIKKNTGDVDLRLDFITAKQYEYENFREQRYYALQNKTNDYLSRARHRNQRQLRQDNMKNLYTGEHKEETFSRTLRKKEQE